MITLTKIWNYYCISAHSFLITLGVYAYMNILEYNTIMTLIFTLITLLISPIMAWRSVNYRKLEKVLEKSKMYKEW